MERYFISADDPVVAAWMCFILIALIGFAVWGSRKKGNN